MKNIFFKLIYAVTAIVILINTGIGIKQSLFPDIADLPSGEMVYTEASPSGDKTFKMYVVKNNVGCGIRGEVTLPDGNTRNVFWQTGIDTAVAVWADDVHIIVNDLPINVLDIPYDCRNGVSLFAEGVLAESFINMEQAS